MKTNDIQIKETFDFLYLNERCLSASQFDFIQGLKKYYRQNKCLSEKQARALFEIRKYLNIDEPIRMTGKQY